MIRWFLKSLSEAEKVNTAGSVAVPPQADSRLLDAYGRELGAHSPAAVRVRMADGDIVDAAVLDYVYAGQQVKLLTNGAGQPLFIAMPAGHDANGNMEYEFMEAARDADGVIQGRHIKELTIFNADGSIYRTIKEEKMILNDSDLSRVVVIDTKSLIYIEPVGLKAEYTAASRNFQANYVTPETITANRDTRHVFKDEKGKKDNTYQIDINHHFVKLYEEYNPIKLLDQIENLSKKEKDKILKQLKKHIKEHSTEFSALAESFKEYPGRTISDGLMRIFLRALIPPTGAESEALLGGINQLLYSYFGGSMNFFFRSMLDYSHETYYADKSDGSPFVINMAGKPELSEVFTDIPEKYTSAYARENGDTGIIIEKRAEGIYFRFSYATSPQDAVEFLVYIKGLIAQAERNLASLKQDNVEYKNAEQRILADYDEKLRKLRAEHGRDLDYLKQEENLIEKCDAEIEKLRAKYENIRVAEETLGSLYSISLTADRRFALSDAGRRDRGLAGVWYFQLDENKPLKNLPQEWLNGKHAGIHIHNDTNVLQVNYFLTRDELQNVLVPALRAAGYDNDFIEKVRIGFKIVEATYYAEIARRGPFMELPADQRQRQVTQAAAFQSIIYDFPHNHIHGSYSQEEYSPHGLTFTTQANSNDQSHNANTLGIMAHSREIEARANAIIDIVLSRYGKGKLVYMLNAALLEYAKDNIKPDELRNVIESIIKKFEGSAKQSQDERLQAVMGVVESFLTGELKDKGKEALVAALQKAIIMDEFTSKDARINKLYSHNYRYLGLLLADTHGRRIPWNMILDEVLQDPRIFPADDRERSLMTTAFQRLNMFQNMDAGKKGAVPYRHRDIVIDDISVTINPKTQISLREALYKVLADELKKGVILKEQIDNTVNLLISAMEWQEKAIPRISELMDKFWASGELSIAEQTELRNLFLSFFAVEADELQRDINNLLANGAEIKTLAQSYLDADIGWNHINQINTGNMSFKKYLEVFGYTRGHSLRNKGAIDKRSWISEVLVAKRRGEKFSPEELREIFGELFAEDMSGHTDSAGGINELARWIVSEHLYLQYSDLRRRDAMAKARAANPLWKKLDELLTNNNWHLKDLDNSLYFPENHAELYSGFVHKKAAALENESIDYIKTKYKTIGYEIMSATIKCEDKNLANIISSLQEKGIEHYYDSRTKELTVKPNVDELHRFITGNLHVDSRRIISYKNGAFTLNLDNYHGVLDGWQDARKLAEQLNAAGYAAEVISAAEVRVESNINSIIETLGESARYDRELTYTANSPEFIKLVLDENLKLAENRALLGLLNADAEYVSDLAGEEEKEISYLTEALNRQVEGILSKLRVSLDEIERWVNEKSGLNKAEKNRTAAEKWFASQTHHKKLMDFFVAQRSELRKSLTEVINNFTQAHQKDMEGLTAIDTGALVERFMKSIEEGQNMLLATTDGTLAEVNRVVDNYRVVAGQDILYIEQSGQSRELTMLEMQIENTIHSREALRSNEVEIDKLNAEDKKIVEALKALLTNNVDHKSKQISFRQLANGRVVNEENPSGYLAAALRLAAQHKPGQEYKRAQHWNIFISDMLGGATGVNGLELRGNYTGVEATIKTIEELSEDKNIEKILGLLKNLSEAEIQALIDQAVNWLESEARYKADLELVLENKGMSRDTVTVLADMLFAQDRVNEYKGELKVDAAKVVDFVNAYHIDSYAQQHITDEKRRVVLDNRILEDYINERFKGSAAERSSSRPLWEREQESMLNIIRISPKYDITLKPDTFNSSYIGITPFESMQKIIKGMLLHYYQWNGQYNIQQVWENFKDEMQRDTISKAMPTILYRGVDYPFFDLLDEIFKIMNDRNLISVEKFGKTGKENYDFELDAMRQRYKKVDELFDGIILEIVDLLPAETNMRDTLLRVATAGLTMDEIEDAMVSENADKDNLFNKFNTIPVLSAYRPDASGNIVNWTTVLLQAQQAMFYVMGNKNQRGGWYDMFDFNRTKSYYDGMKGFLQNQGCFNKNLRMWATYLHLLRGIMNVAVPIDNSIMNNKVPGTVANNPNPPKYGTRLVTEVGIPAAAAAALSLIVPEFLLPFLPPLLINVLTSGVYLNLVPKFQEKANEINRRVSVLQKDDTAILRLEKLQQTLDLSKIYSAVEDYRITTEMMKSFLWGRQIMSFIGSALAEGDHDVTALVQFPRWFGAIMELSPVELLDAKFMKKFAKQHGIPQGILKELVKFREEAGFHDLHPMAMYYNLRFSMVMTMYAAFGFSPFSFAGPLGVLLGPAPLIAGFALFSLNNYRLIKNQIATHHWLNAISRPNERVAEDRSNTINSILIPRIELILTNLNKMKFITSQPVEVPMRRYADDIYFGKTDAYRMQMAAKLQYRQSSEELKKLLKQAGENRNKLLNEVAAPLLAECETEDQKIRIYEKILKLAKSEADFQNQVLQLEDTLHETEALAGKEQMLAALNALSYAADLSEEEKMELLDKLVEIGRLEKVIKRAENDIAKRESKNPLGFLKRERFGIRFNNWHNRVRKHMPKVAMGVLGFNAALNLFLGNWVTAGLSVGVLLFSWFSLKNLFLRPKDYVEKGISGNVPSLLEAELYRDREFEYRDTQWRAQNEVMTHE